MNAFCLDVEKPSVDWHVLQMSVFFVNVLTCNLCSFCTNIIRSFEVRVTELEEQTPKRIICYCSYSSCSTDYSKLASLYPSFSLFSFFSLSSSVCFEEAQTELHVQKKYFYVIWSNLSKGLLVSVGTFCSVQGSDICICSRTEKNNSPPPTGDIPYKAY